MKPARLVPEMISGTSLIAETQSGKFILACPLCGREVEIEPDKGSGLCWGCDQVTYLVGAPDGEREALPGWHRIQLEIDPELHPGCEWLIAWNVETRADQ